MQTKLQDIKFGYASAEQEGVSEPDLLTKGYLDYFEIIREARDSPKFLFLGYKGSGKSAIAEHLKLIANNKKGIIVKTVTLADMPYSQLKEIVWGRIENEARYPLGWSWLILTTLYESLLQDSELAGENILDFRNIIQILKVSGMIPLPTWRQVILASSKRSFRLNVPESMQSNLEKGLTEQGLQIQFFVDKMTSIIEGVNSKTKHILIIDGLDDILSSRKAQFDALAALILTANQLNLKFQRKKSPVKIIILCRTDLYEKLPGANKNKIRQDSAIVLDWYQDPRQPKDSKLISLLNLRARLVDEHLSNLFAKYFPKKVEDRDIINFLLELTRHTPRDVIQLMRHIQDFSGPYYVTTEEVQSGARSYSVNYFLPEIKDELVGYASDEEIKATIDLIGSLRKRDFYFNELLTKIEDKNGVLTLERLKAITASLFECSAIGNIHRKGENTFYTFKYRNRNSTLNFDDRLILHRGMWKALNVG